LEKRQKKKKKKQKGGGQREGLHGQVQVKEKTVWEVKRRADDPPGQKEDKKECPGSKNNHTRLIEVNI